MIKQLIIGLIVIGGFFSAQAQYSNDWVDHSQPYLKVSFVKEGIYRIDQPTLESAILALGLTVPDPRNFQIFGRGVEQYIHVEGEEDGTFDPTDFLEFHGQPNDGWLDTCFYDSLQAQANPYYSLITDTASYFITWNTSTSNRRQNDIHSFDFTGYPTASYFMFDAISFGSDDFEYGEKDSEGKTEPKFVNGEGWYFNRFNSIGGALNVDLATPSVYLGAAPAPITTVRLAGVNNPGALSDVDHHVEVRVDGTLITDTTFADYSSFVLNTELTAAQLGANASNTFQFSNAAQSNADARSNVAWIKSRYAHSTDFNSDNTLAMHFEVIANSDSTYIFANNTASITHIYNLTDHERMEVEQIGGQFKVLVGPGGAKQCFLSSNIVNLTDLIPVNNNTGFFTDFDTPVIAQDSAYLMVTHRSMWSQAQAYKTHRLATGHAPVLADVQELYDQFGYGIPKHPVAIRNWSNFMLNKYNAQWLFLMGKSVDARLNRQDANEFNATLVPTWGVNGSDNLITTGLDGSLVAPTIPTGRIAVFDNASMASYLSKIQEYELNPTRPHTISERSWMKDVLHFGGGGFASEQAQFKQHLSDYEATLEAPNYGAQTFKFFKTSNDPIQGDVPDSIIQIINNGVSLMTFFGHAGGGSFDISVDDVDDYQNTDGRYPLFTAVSCFAGNVHQSAFTSVKSTSERFVLSERGAIGFLATVGLGYANALHLIADEFFKEMSVSGYGNSVGEQLKAALSTQNADSFKARASSHEFTLHCDPAVIINHMRKPDYAISEDAYHECFFTPEIINASLDSFELHLVVYNLGQAISDSMEVRLTRNFPGGTQEVQLLKFPSVKNKDTLVVKLPIDHTAGLGTNTFDVYIDPDFLIEESDNISNNQITNGDLELYITSSDLIPIYPSKYAIVPDANITLKASTSDPLAESRDYLFEISKDGRFQTGVTNHQTTSAGGIVSWSPNSSTFSGDSTVYFWRTSPYFPSNPDSFSWRTSSFQVIDGETGWSQDDFDQFNENDYLLIDHDTTDNTFQFRQDTTSINCTVVGDANSVLEYRAHEFDINGIMQDYGVCWGAEMVNVVVVDPYTLKPWQSYHYLQNPDGNHYGNANDDSQLGGDGYCHNVADNFFAFKVTSTEDLDSLASFVTNHIPDGHFVMMYTTIRGRFQSNWPAATLTALTNMGATNIASVGDSIPYIFFVEKGNPSTALEAIGQTTDEILTLNAKMWNTADRGNISSTVIGPATSWGKFEWDEAAVENGQQDSVKVMVYGINPNGSEDLLATFDQTEQLIPDLSIYGADNYTYLKLSTEIEDVALETCSQFDKWQVYFDEIPEAALNAKAGYSFLSDTLNEGENVSLLMAIQNVTDRDMDSLRVNYWVKDANGGIHLVDYPKQAPLLGGATLADTVSYSTQGLAGENSFFIEVNPDDSLWQIEQFHFNNQARLKFFVNTDGINPLLDVTFDGIHILNGDIVSPEPQILVQLDDENVFMALDDTADFSLYLTTPDLVRTRIPFIDDQGTEILTFTPGELPDNKAQVLYAPKFTEDGLYKLSVQATDASKNAAGTEEYSIEFEVINKSTITHIFNYPNPFSTSTQFVYTLTGANIPDVFTIQILSVSGKVVREITKEELGSINIGRNMSDYKWDGTDEFGDPLANGVYMYRVITKINDEEIEQRKTSADHFFTENFGKLYIIR